MNEKKADLSQTSLTPYSGNGCDIADVASNTDDSTIGSTASPDNSQVSAKTHVAQKLQRRSDALRENLLKRKQQMRARV